ncbi:MAG: sulfatase-like hydrolase/transferase [Thermoanaerobaculia bacterium]
MSRSRSAHANRFALGALIAGLVLAPGCGRRTAAPPSILVVTLDTTRADHLGAYGAAPGTTPALDRLAAEGVRFENAFAVVPMTLPAHAAMFTGKLPAESGVRWNGAAPLDTATPTLASRAAGAGYATGAFVSAAVLDAGYGLAAGFDRYDDEVGAGGTFRAERAGTETVRRALDWLAAQASERPLLLWVHLFEPHAPYRPPPPFDRTFADDPYSGEIAAMDAALAPLLDHPRFRAGAGAIVAVVGDHGEGLGEHGERTHGVLVDDAALRIPWIVRAPGLAAGVRHDDVAQVDLAPTLLSLAGLPALPRAQGMAQLAADGEATPVRGRTLFAESLYGQRTYGWAPLFAARRDGWKLVRGARDELYEIGGDPGERRDRLADSGDRASALGRALEAMPQAPRPAASNPTPPADPALAASLASLGYLTPLAGPAGDAGAAPDPRDRIAVHERFRRMDEAIARDDVESALRDLGEILAADPGNELALRAVEAQLRTAIARTSDADTVLRLRLPLARILAAGGRRDEALALFRQVAASPATADAAIAARARARLETGDRESARADWTELARRSPGDGSAALNLASLALAERDFAAAERWSRTALRIDPASSAAHNALGIALEESGRSGAAESEYRAALQSDPAFFRAELNLALLRAHRGRGDDRAQAVAGLERVVRLAPREPMALWESGRLAAGDGRRELARERLEAFLAVAPGHPRGAEARRLLAGLERPPG